MPAARDWAFFIDALCVFNQERTYRSPEKRSSLPRPAKSLTRHIPAAEQEDNSTPSRPTCKNAPTFPVLHRTFQQVCPPNPLNSSRLPHCCHFDEFLTPTTVHTLSCFSLLPHLYFPIAFQSRGDSRSGRTPGMAGRPPLSSCLALLINM